MTDRLRAQRVRARAECLPELRKRKTRMQGDIKLRGVCFAYPARSDVQVFDDLDLDITAGQTVALVGQSGSGKSTIIQLLERFYDPLAGTIEVDGHNIRSLSLPWYRDQVGLVSQEPTLFATSIRENIALGREGATEKEIQEAAKSANAHDFHHQAAEGVQHAGRRGWRAAQVRPRAPPERSLCGRNGCVLVRKHCLWRRGTIL